MDFIGSVGLMLVILGAVLLIQGEASTLLAVLVFFIGVVLTGFLSKKFTDIIFARAAKIKYRKWDKASAEIIKIEWSKRIGTRGGMIALFQQSIFDVDYKYIYNGKEYIGRSIIDFKPKDNKLEIYVNPQNPRESEPYK